ncbi:MAG: sensor histidine kinase, partial [Lachnospiraceae bacterium]
LVFLNELILASASDFPQNGVLKDYNLRCQQIAAPTGKLLIFVDISSEINAINALIQNCIFIGIFSFFAFLGISIFFANWAVRPVDIAWNQQKQFLADASHELKTPLTVILTNAELLQDSDADIVNNSHLAENIWFMANRMKKLVEGLLELSRMDGTTTVSPKEKLDFSIMAETSICLFEPLFFENNLELISEIQSGIQVNGCEEQLKQVMDILLDNALKYSLPHTQVIVCLEKHPFGCLFSVSSHGKTIAPKELKNIFKRFYRIDKSRSSNSYGLGLSIAQGIVAAHHGKIWAESREGVNTFFIRLSSICK